MKLRFRLLLLQSAQAAIVAASLLLFGCELPEEQELAGAGADLAAAGELPGNGFMYEEVVADDAWPAPVLELLEATAACPVDDVAGAPVPGWQPVLVSSGGCTQWIPPDWLILGQADQIFFAFTESQKASAFTINLTLELGSWSLAGLADMTLAELGVRYGTDKPQLLLYQEYLEDLTPSADVVFTFDIVGTPVVGYLRVVFPGCSEQSQKCYAWLAGYWMPETDISTYACGLVQIDASLDCPGR